MTATGLQRTITKFINENSPIQPNHLVFIFELSGCGTEPGSTLSNSPRIPLSKHYSNTYYKASLKNGVFKELNSLILLESYHILIIVKTHPAFS